MIFLKESVILKEIVKKLSLFSLERKILWKSLDYIWLYVYYV